MCMGTPDFCFTDLGHGERIIVEAEQETGESTYHACQSQEVAGPGKQPDQGRLVSKASRELFKIHFNLGDVLSRFLPHGLLSSCKLAVLKGF